MFQLRSLFGIAILFICIHKYLTGILRFLMYWESRWTCTHKSSSSIIACIWVLWEQKWLLFAAHDSSSLFQPHPINRAIVRMTFERHVRKCTEIRKTCRNEKHILLGPLVDDLEVIYFCHNLNRLKTAIIALHKKRKGRKHKHGFWQWYAYNLLANRR